MTKQYNNRGTSLTCHARHKCSIKIIHRWKNFITKCVDKNSNYHYN